MSHNEVFKKTMPFVWAKLLLGLITVGVSLLLFLLFAFIAWLTGWGGSFFLFIVWVALTSGLHFFLMRYVGYLVKAGHVAVVAEAVTTGKVPENQVEYGKNMVKKRFLSANVFFLIDGLVDRAVKQIQNRIGRLGGFVLGSVPGAGIILSFGKFFIGISLKYVDECCMGWIFHNKEQKAFKSAVDGIVIYAQNWKKLLKTAFKTSLTVVCVSAVIAIVMYSFINGFFHLLAGGLFFRNPVWSLIIFVLSIYVAIAIKNAFIDSYMMVRMMVSYMEVAPSTKISFDLYGKLCKISTGFKKLFDKSKEEKAEQQQSEDSSFLDTFIPSDPHDEDEFNWDGV